MNRDERARENGIPLMYTNQARDKLVMDLLALAYTRGADRARDAHIEVVWQKRFGVPFFAYRPTATYLRGFPGHGKTTAFHAAATEVAQLLGLELVWEPEVPCKVDARTLLVKTVNFSGEVSNNAVAGIPLVEGYNGAGHGGETTDRFTRRAPPFALAVARHAGLALIVLDDMPNAAPGIQNVANDLLDRGRAQGLDLGRRCLVGATGNLGSEDATAVSSTSTATATRANSYHIQDRLEDWGPRTIQMYPDPVGDAGVVAFLESHPDLFHKPSRSKKGEPYPTPRTWSRCVEEHLRPMYSLFAHPSLDDQVDVRARALNGACERAAGLVGPEAADKLRAHYSSVLDKSLPLAQEVLRTGQLSAASVKAFKKRYGAGASADEEAFLRQFYTCLVDSSAQGLVADYLNGDKDSFTRRFDALLTGLYGYSANAAHLGWVAHYLFARMVALGDDADRIGIVDARTGTVVPSLALLAAMTDVVKGNAPARAGIEAGAERKTIFEVTFLSELTGIDRDASPGDMLAAAVPFNPKDIPEPATGPTTTPSPSAPAPVAPQAAVPSSASKSQPELEL